MPAKMMIFEVKEGGGKGGITKKESD